MSVPASTNAPSQPPSPDQETALWAEPGDTLFVEVAGAPGVPRTGTVIGVTGPDGRPPYLVRWTTGDYVSRFAPGPGARIERRSA